MTDILLSLITFIPLLVAVGLLFINKDQHELIKRISAVAVGIQLILSVLLFILFEGQKRQ